MSAPIIALLMTDAFDDKSLAKGGFTPEFIALADQAFGGDPLAINLYIRDNDGVDGIPGTLLFPTFPAVGGSFGGETVTEINPITRRREVEFGVVEGNAWMVKVTNNNNWFKDYALYGSWCAIYGQLGNYASIFAQGKIVRARYNTDGTVVLEIHDSIMDALSYTLTRDMRFQRTGWVSDVSVDNKASGSKLYASSGLTLTDPFSPLDETFIMEMTSPTTYKVILEDGDESQTGLISSDLTISGIISVPFLTIGTAGWDTVTSGAYSAGDRFVFYTSQQRQAYQLTPIWMIRELLDDVMGLTAYDTLNGIQLSDARSDSTNWANKSAEFNTVAFTMAGTWKRGTSIITMIQDILKIVHGSIYPAPDGRIALWVLDAGPEISLTLNGNPSAGHVQLAAGAVTEDASTVTSDVVFSYLTLDDAEDATASASADDADYAWFEPRSVEVSIGWEIQGAAVQSSAEKYIARFKDPLRRFELDTTLAGSVGEIGKAVLVTDDVMGVSAEQSDIVNMSVDMIGNSAQVQAYVDPVSFADFFTLDVSIYDGTDGYS